jgi:hypothetical protein
MAPQVNEKLRAEKEGFERRFMSGQPGCYERLAKLSDEMKAPILYRDLDRGTFEQWQVRALALAEKLWAPL